MPDLLIELRSEEIPARMQRKAAGDLRKLVTDGLVEAGLTYEGCQEYFTPRRLALDVRGLTARSRDVREERKGPSTRAPEAAIQGFLRSAGLTEVSQAEVQSDPKKGDFYVARITKPGRAAEDIIAGLMPQVIRTFPWPKEMRWGASSGPKGMRYGRTEGRGGETLRWVRPLQSIVCTFGPETSDPVVVDFEVDGIRSGNITYGHRFHSPGAFTVRRFEDYAAKLEAAKVVIDAERRKQIILSDARNLAFASGLELVEDEGLLEEVAGLVEWPVVLMGEFEEDFLQIPAEVIRLTIRANQKCFVTRPSLPLGWRVGAERAGVGSVAESATPIGAEAVQSTPPRSAARIDPPLEGEGGAGTLSNRFILTANIEARDGGAEIARGNGKVVRARLSDALYFWRTDQADMPDLDRLVASAEKFALDLKKPLDQRMARLDHLGVTFHAKLGTQGERVERIRRLARELAPSVGADPDLADRAAVLAKADLQTEVVGEFPELQGAMGRKYALLQGEDPSVAAAIEEHYKPQGPSDRVPSDPVSIAVALADKLDTLVGFWAIDEKPTGSKDPFALRRAALGVIRILVENGVRLRLREASLKHALEWLATIDDYGLSAPMIAYEGTEASSELKALARAAVRAPFVAAIVSPSQIRLKEIEELHDRDYDPQSPREDWIERIDSLTLWVGLVSEFRSGGRDLEILMRIDALGAPLAAWAMGLQTDLLSFFHDRLKVYLREKGARHDLIDAVLSAGSRPISPLVGEMSAKPTEGGAVPPTQLMPQREQPYDVDHGHSTQPLSPVEGEMAAKQSEGGASGGTPGTSSTAEATPPGGSAATLPSGGRQGTANDDLLLVVSRVAALGIFLDTDDGKNLLAGTKRAANILAAEEKKGTAVAGFVDPEKFREPAEQALFSAVNHAESEAAQAIALQDFSAAMLALSALREPVDAFFEKVLVNDEDAQVRANRLALLSRIRAATGQVADFSKIAG